MTFSAALIGCGRIGAGVAGDSQAVGIYSHAAAYAACPHTRLVAACDADARQAGACAERWSAAPYTDVGEMLAVMRPEMVSICTPDGSHAAILEQVLACDSVRAVLAEKPLAVDLAAARKLAVCARDRGILLAVNYSRRYGPGQRVLAERLQNGLIGRIQRIQGVYTKGVCHNGGHWFDWVRLLAGSQLGDPVRIAAFPGSAAYGQDPSPDVRLEFADGAAAQLTALDHNLFSLFEIDLIGTAGRLRLLDSGLRYRLDVAADSPYYAGYRTLVAAEEGDVDMRDTLLHAVTDLATAVQEGRRPACSGDDGVAALAIADAACRSLAAAGALLTVTP